MLLELEKKYGVKFVISEDSVYVEGLKERDLKPIKKTLSDAWKMNNFQRLLLAFSAFQKSLTGE